MLAKDTDICLVNQPINTVTGNLSPGMETFVV